MYGYEYLSNDQLKKEYDALDNKVCVTDAQDNHKDYRMSEIVRILRQRAKGI